MDLGGQNIADGGVVLLTLVLVPHLLGGAASLPDGLLEFIVLKSLEHVVRNLLLYGGHPLLDQPVDFRCFDRYVETCVPFVDIVSFIEGRLPKVQFYWFFFVEFCLIHIKIDLCYLYIVSILLDSGREFGLFLFDGTT